MPHSRKLLCCSIVVLAALSALPSLSLSQKTERQANDQHPDTSGFTSGSNHWYSIADEEHVINPLPSQRRYKAGEVSQIADNILLYQKKNGGWPKNYDMMAILTDTQKRTLRNSRDEINTTFDNGATYEQVQYLAHAYTLTKERRYRDACLRGLEFILKAQYPNGGWPQFFPDTSGYRKYITFNDGAMIGVMQVLFDIVRGEPRFAFLDAATRSRAHRAFEKGLDALLRCQIREDGVVKGWGQQHDNVDFRPQYARSYELPSICAGESSDIVLFLMEIPNPTPQIVSSVQNAVRWFESTKILGLRVQEVRATRTQFMFHTADFDRVVTEDPKAPPIWARFYELRTERPLFCNRDGKAVYSLAEVDRERRTGYGWYTYGPARVLDRYSSWQKKWIPGENVRQH